MKILVMGTGAVGGCFGGMLSHAGYDVTFVARGANLEAIRANGLRVESVAAGNFTVNPPLIERPDGTWKADLVLFCVKSYHNEAAMEEMAGAVGDGTAILTLQNGLGSGDLLSKRFGREKVLLGAAYIEAARKAPGVFAELGGGCRVAFGEQDGAETERAVRIRDSLERAKVDVELSADVQTSLWNKLVVVCAFSGMACITRASFVEVLDTRETSDLTRQVMQEAADVGRAVGAQLADDVVDSGMANLERHKHELSSSMYLDLQAGNPLEVGVLNGAVSRYGKEAGVATPANDFITACLTVADRRARLAQGTGSSS
ncbi:MAG: ketopantoate reductase family protein [Chloroflexi bacterium]|nr:ketopantoate reductase family protein [Chloroflexota bacterium]